MLVQGVDSSYNRANDSFHITMTNTRVEHDVAVRELRKAKEEIGRLDKEHHEVIIILYYYILMIILSILYMLQGED